jgi:hypothetical protein
MDRNGKQQQEGYVAWLLGRRCRLCSYVIVPLGLALFFMMLFVPTAYQFVKAGLLAALLGAMLVGHAISPHKLSLHPLVFYWIVILVGTGVAFIILGYWNGAPGALRVITVYVLWPIVFGIFVAAASSARYLFMLFNMLIFAGIALGLYGVLFFGQVSDQLPAWSYIELDQGQDIGLYDGFIEYNMYSISTLIFLVPFLFAALLQHHKENAWTIDPRWLWLSYLFCFALGVLSGRRALWVIMVITPAVCSLLVLCTPAMRKSLWSIAWRTLCVTLSSIALLLVLKDLFELSPERSLTYLLGGVFDAKISLAESAVVENPESGTRVRHSQAEALLEGWLESPWVGWGHGSAAAVIRSEAMPWAYELQYHALLFQVGIIGFLMYFGCILWVFLQGLWVMRVSRQYGLLMFPLLVGLFCFLIANATNPYLLKFDFMWTIFLPLAVINRFLIEQNSQKLLG